MAKIKVLVLSGLVMGGTLMGSGCISSNRLFNVWDFGISAAATLFGVNLAGLAGLAT